MNKSAFNTIKKKIKKALIIFIILNVLYIFTTKWLMPPITFTQLQFLIKHSGDTIKLKKKYITYNEMSINIKKAAIAGEDLHFFSHYGFDWGQIKKAFDSINSNNPIGSSSISQQTAKNVFLWQGGGFIRKVPESIYTLFIELIWGKKRILEVYLNVIEMGDGVFGIEAASQLYFKKSAKYLSKSEAVMIITCLPNPKKFQPDKIASDSVLTNRYERIMYFFDNIKFKN
jgi:monofunctional biosynthetic peptidoglycan transglycosylase